jgi:hypothetical protein
MHHMYGAIFCAGALKVTASLRSLDSD